MTNVEKSQSKEDPCAAALEAKEAGNNAYKAGDIDVSTDGSSKGFIPTVSTLFFQYDVA